MSYSSRNNSVWLHRLRFRRDKQKKKKEEEEEISIGHEGAQDVTVESELREMPPAYSWMFFLYRTLHAEVVTGNVISSTVH